MEIESPRNFEKGGDQLSVPEQLVMDENESSGNAEMGGEDDSIMHVGGEIAPNELTEFDNNLVGVKKFPKEGIEEKDVLMSLALMGEIIGGQCRVKRRNNENAKLIAEEAVQKVRESNKVREIYWVFI